MQLRLVAGQAGLHAGEDGQPVVAGQMLAEGQFAVWLLLGFGKADDGGFGGWLHGAVPYYDLSPQPAPGPRALARTLYPHDASPRPD